MMNAINITFFKPMLKVLTLHCCLTCINCRSQ